MFFLPVITGKGAPAYKRQEVPDIYGTRLYKFFSIWDVEVAVWPPQTENLQAAAARETAALAAVTE